MTADARTLPIVDASFCQSCSSIFPDRIRVSGTRASAASRRIVISLRLISREKMTDDIWWCTAACVATLMPTRSAMSRVRSPSTPFSTISCRAAAAMAARRSSVGARRGAWVTGSSMGRGFYARRIAPSIT